jgi:hypothetical protein
VSKRRGRDRPEDETETRAAELSPLERRRLRKRERAARDAGNVRPKRGWSPLRRGLVLGVPAAIVVVIVVILLFNPFQPPCLQLQSIPASSGIPAFPPHNQTDLSTSWCPPAVTPVFQSFPLLTIDIGRNPTLSLPTSIGRNTTYVQNHEPYTCQLPIFTDTPAQGGLPTNTIYIISPWNYIYTLGDFFSVWSQSYATVNVNATFPNQPISYTSSSLLGFTADSTHTITLWVDNQVSSAGPDLNLDTLSNAPNVSPSCLGTIYHTGHTILLSYTSTKVGSARVGLQSPALSTGGGVPDLALALYDSPAVHLGPYLAFEQWAGYLEHKGLGWLTLRGD